MLCLPREWTLQHESYCCDIEHPWGDAEVRGMELLLGAGAPGVGEGVKDRDSCWAPCLGHGAPATLALELTMTQPGSACQEAGMEIACSGFGVGNLTSRVNDPRCGALGV